MRRACANWSWNTRPAESLCWARSQRTLRPCGERFAPERLGNTRYFRRTRELPAEGRHTATAYKSANELFAQVPDA